MSGNDRFHPVYRSLNKPLTIMGAERRLFFLAMIMGGATLNFFSLLASVLMFSGLYALARWATVTDQQIFRIFVNASRFRSRYDPVKFEPYAVVRIRRDHIQAHH